MSESNNANVYYCVLALTTILYQSIIVAKLIILTKQLTNFDDDLESI